MFFNLMNRKLRSELEELKSHHRIAIAEKEAVLQREIKDVEIRLVQKYRDLERDLRLKEEKLKAIEADLRKENEIKTREITSLLKIDHEGKIRQFEIDKAREIAQIKHEAMEAGLKMKEDLLKNHYDKLASAMTKLHEEGNVTTKFTQEIALKMLGNAPTNKNETRVLTGTIPEK